jgi:Protein of unknown function (DUF3298)
MKIKIYIKNALTAFIISISVSTATAQSINGWYKVFTGKMGNYTAILHLHKSAKNYGGYLWFMQNQWPMQLYYNAPLDKTDSLQLSANSGPMVIVLSGVLTGDGFTGISEFSKDNGAPKKAGFQLQAVTEKAFTPFGYFYAEGSASLPAQFKNESQCDYTASSVWPVNNTSTGQALKNEIRKGMGIKTPVAEIGKWLIDEKNRYLSAWKKENSKLSPKEAADMGLSLSVQQEDRVMVMYENEKNIVLAHYSYSYSGGAHGNFMTTLATFNKQTGKKLKLSDVISAAGVQVLPRILDQVARLQYSVKNNKPLDQNDFLVNKIEPSQNFYVTGNGIGFVYAPYAIKSFADGEINLLVPFTLLKAYLQPGIGAK